MSNTKNKNGASAPNKNIIITICVIVVAALIIGLAVYNKVDESGILLRAQTAAKSENFEVNGVMMSYFFNSAVSQYSSYFSVLGVDTTKSLKGQAFSADQSWFDYFAESTKQTVGELLSLCEYAKANGIELTDEAKTSVDDTIKTIETNAALSGYSLEQYLLLAFGSGMKVKDVRACLELSALAELAYDAYIESLDYTDEELQAYYEANKEEFDGIDYLAYTIPASTFTVYGEDGEATSETADDIAAAKAEAEKFAAATSVDEFKSLIVAHLNEYHADHEGHSELENDQTADEAYVRHAVADSLTDEELSTWAFAAAVGDTRIEPNEDGDEFTVYFIAKTAYRDEEQNRDVRHILFSSSTYEDSTKADEIFAELEAADFSDEKWNEFFEEYNEDPGSEDTMGVYEEVAIGQRTNTFNAWLFDEDRKVGDRAVVETTNGWHIMEYLGLGEKLAWQTNANESKQSDDYTAMIEEQEKSITFSDKVIYDINA